MRTSAARAGSAKADLGPLWVLSPGVRGDPAEVAGLATAMEAAEPGIRVKIALTPEGPERTLQTISARLFADLPPAPVHWIGASFGGLLGRAAPPGRVAALVCVGAMPCPGPSARRAGRLGRLIGAGPDRGRAGGALEAAYRLAYAGARAGTGLAIPPRAVMAARLQAIAAWGLARVDLQAGGPIPAWCLWGDQDGFVDWGEAEARAAGMIPAVVRGGHFPHLEDPAGLWRAIRALTGGPA